MGAEPQLFRINPENRESEKIAEVEFASLGFQERRDIQEWVAANPGILGEGLLIIGKEFGGFDRTDERLDLLAVDADGTLVIIELKRDDTGADAHWQAIKYASYLHRATADEIVRMLAEHADMPESDAADWLLEHLNADDFNALNNDQRIILASHRFAPEVTSAALWLNEKAPGDDLITCVQLTPYRDGEAGSLYVQANTIIPVPGVDDYVVGIGDSPSETLPIRRGVSKRAQTIARIKNDEISKFLKRVAERATDSLPDGLKPDGSNRWARIRQQDGLRYYRLWYSWQPWHSDRMRYEIQLNPKTSDASGTWLAQLGFRYRQDKFEGLDSRIFGLHICDEQTTESGWTYVSRHGDDLDDSFADVLANAMVRFIEVITPEIEEYQGRDSEEVA